MILLTVLVVFMEIARIKRSEEEIIEVLAEKGSIFKAIDEKAPLAAKLMSLSSSMKNISLPKISQEDIQGLLA